MAQPVVGPDGAGPAAGGLGEPGPGSDRDPGAGGLPAWGWLGVYVAYRWLFDLVRLPPRTPDALVLLGVAVSSVAAIGLPVGILVALLRRHEGRGAARQGLTAAGLGLALWGALVFVGSSGGAALAALAGAGQDAGKVLAAAGVGMALAAALREPNILLPAGVFAAFADFVVVRFGTVKHALSTEKGQAMVQAVSAKVPSLHPALPSLTIGPADFLFLGIFLACAARFEMGLRRNAWVLTGVLAASLLAVPLVGALPALAPMSAAFVAVNWRRFRLTREELAATGLVLLLAGGLFLGYFLFLFPRGK